jgi:hypothetical protein
VRVAAALARAAPVGLESELKRGTLAASIHSLSLRWLIVRRHLAAAGSDRHLDRLARPGLGVGHVMSRLAHVPKWVGRFGRT